MEIVNEYIFNENTVLIIGEFDIFGNFISKIIEGEKSFLVKMEPKQLINKNLLLLGSDFNGAINSSKEILGSVKMQPIKVNGYKNIWLFPSKSFKKENCVWFSLFHVINTKSLGVRKTKINLNFGHSFIIEMKESAFNNKRIKAKELRESILKNENSTFIPYDKPSGGYFICKDPNENNYKVMKKEEEEEEE